MAEAADQLEQRISETRADLDDKLARLEDRARDTLSIPRRVRRRPWAALGSAAAAGLVAGLVRGKGSNYERRTGNPGRRASDHGIRLADFGTRSPAAEMRPPSPADFGPGPTEEDGRAANVHREGLRGSEHQDVMTSDYRVRGYSPQGTAKVDRPSRSK